MNENEDVVAAVGDLAKRVRKIEKAARLESVADFFKALPEGLYVLVGLTIIGFFVSLVVLIVQVGGGRHA